HAVNEAPYRVQFYVLRKKLDKLPMWKKLHPINASTETIREPNILIIVSDFILYAMMDSSTANPPTALARAAVIPRKSHTFGQVTSKTIQAKPKINSICINAKTVAAKNTPIK